MQLGISIAYGPVSIALTDNQALLAALTLKNSYEFSENLILEIQALIKKCSKDLSQLDAIGISVGPGSYTGLRIGVTLAKTLGQMLGIPVIPVSTLEGLAFQHRFYPGVMFCIIPARKNEVNLAMFSAKNNTIQRLSKDICVKTEHLSKTFQQIEGGFLICGELSQSILDFAAERDKITLSQSHLHAETLAEIANSRKTDAIPLKAVHPVYSHEPTIGTIKKKTN